MAPSAGGPIYVVPVLSAVLTTLVGALCAAAETALSAMPESHLQALATDPKTPFARFAADPSRILSRWLVTRVVCISLAATLYHQAAERAGLLESAPVVAALLSVLTYGTFTEILSTIARRRPEKYGLMALRFFRPLEWAVIPLAEPLAVLGRAVSLRLPEERAPDARLTETEVAWAVTEGERSGALDNKPAELIRNVLDFKDLTARELMVPRKRIHGIELSTPLADVVAHVAAEGHSRYPVYRESLDNVVGLLYAKDLFAASRDGRIQTATLASLMRIPVLFVAETQPVARILPEMQSRRLHMAVVVDEFGGTSGLVTLEDILEEIVGDIRDEYDTEAQITELGAGRVMADAAVSLSDLGEHLGRSLPNEGDFESLGGLIVHRTGRVPDVGATVEVDGLQLIVREADATRVMKVEIVAQHAEDHSPQASSLP